MLGMNCRGRRRRSALASWQRASSFRRGAVGLKALGLGEGASGSAMVSGCLQRLFVVTEDLDFVPEG